MPRLCLKNVTSSFFERNEPVSTSIKARMSRCSFFKAVTILRSMFFGGKKDFPELHQQGCAQHKAILHKSRQFPRHHPAGGIREGQRQGLPVHARKKEPGPDNQGLPAPERLRHNRQAQRRQADNVEGLQNRPCAFIRDNGRQAQHHNVHRPDQHEDAVRRC